MPFWGSTLPHTIHRTRYELNIYIHFLFHFDTLYYRCHCGVFASIEVDFTTLSLWVFFSFCVSHEVCAVQSIKVFKCIFTKYSNGIWWVFFPSSLEQQQNMIWLTWLLNEFECAYQHKQQEQQHKVQTMLPFGRLTFWMFFFSFIYFHRCRSKLMLGDWLTYFVICYAEFFATILKHENMNCVTNCTNNSTKKHPQNRTDNFHTM